MRNIYREAGDPLYTTLKVDSLIVGKRLPFPVYVKDKGVTRPLFEKEMVFTNAAKAILRERGISEVYIETEDDAALDAYLTARKRIDEAAGGEPSTFARYSFYKDQHYQIDKALLMPGTSVPFSIFQLHKFSLTPLVIATEKSPARIDEGVFSADGDIVIKNSDIPLYHHYLTTTFKAQNLPEDRIRSIMPIMLRERAKLAIRDLLVHPETSERISKAKSIVGELMECIQGDREKVYELLSLTGNDSYTYTHSVNVAVLSIGLGHAINMKQQDIEKLGIGAILHDVGKSSVPQEILNKQGKLNDTEYQIIKNHVLESERLLHSSRDIPKEAHSVILQHHEKLTGKGYPYRLTAREINLFGRISALADCFDALTSNRPYRHAYTPFYALSIIAKEIGDYDHDLLKSFILMLGKMK